jgi:RimJ/RimL family protein N-acetyltransferase
VAEHDDQPLVSTQHLIVRRWQVDETERFVDIYRRDDVVRWLGGEPIRDARQAVEMIERNLERQRGGSRFGSWAVVERSTGVPAGSVILQPLPDGHGEVEIGWHLHPDRWGRGYATEAARAVLRRGLADGLAEIWAVTFLDNARSAAVCRRIGMRLLGITSRWYHEPHLMFWAGATPEQQPSLAPDASTD